MKVSAAVPPGERWSVQAQAGGTAEAALGIWRVGREAGAQVYGS